MRRRLLLALAALLAVLLIAAASVPLWLGAAAGALGRSRGLTFSRYEQIGYARFALHDVEFRRHHVRVTASRVEADTPVLWGWRHLRSAERSLRADRWLVEVQKKPAGAPVPPRPSEPGWVPLHAQLRRIAAQLARWLPRAQLGPGLVRFPGGEIAAEGAVWSGRELTIEGLGFRALEARATASFPAEADLIRLVLDAPESQSRVTIESRAGGQVTGELMLWQQPATLAASFAPQGWLPAEASLRAEAWQLPGGRLKLGDAYAVVHGRAQIDYRERKFSVDVAARGDPVAGKKVPPLAVTLRGAGDLQAFTIEALDAQLPGIVAQLGAPVTIDRAGRVAGASPSFHYRVDLAQQPWFAARGTLGGEARVVRGGLAAPVIEFRAQGAEISAQDLAVSGLTAEGRFEWPRVQLSRGEIVGGEGEQLVMRGGWDFRAKEILNASVEGKLRRATFARWLPAQPAFDVVSVRALASGTLAEFAHSGEIEASDVRFGALNAAALHAEWRGRGLALENITARAKTGATTLRAAGGLTRTALQLRELELARADAPLLRLTRPTELRWRPALTLEALHLAGPEGSLDAALTWGERGRIEIAARQISSHWIADLVPAAGPPWRVELLAATAEWDRGPMKFSLTAGVQVDLGDERSAAVNVAARGDKDGVLIDALRAIESGSTVVNATGRVPVRFQPGAKPFARIEPEGVVQLDATAEPNAALWQKLGAAAGVEMLAPEAALHVRGTWAKPQGEVRLKAQRIGFDPKRFPRALPQVEALDVQLSADRTSITLANFALAVEGQAVRAHGRLPVPDGDWRALMRQPLAAVVRGADARLEIAGAEIAAFARFLPAMLAPKGRVQLNAGMRHGRLDGFLELHDAASRPLGPLGVLQEINAKVALHDRRIELREVSAKSGGQPVALTGTIELPDFILTGGARGPMIPRFDLALKGENLPFVRQTGTLIRGDLDLALQTQGNSGGAKISGQVRLRDSLFLQDVRAFLPRGGGGGAARRPPYFEVSTPPLNTWTLAVEVIGDRFLRLRTPVFNGTASAHFRLGGTLGEPRAIGDVVIDEGRVKMPFAGFDVRQGAVRLTEANPYEPTICLRATGRRYGYDLTMEIEGNAASPNVEFTSSPGLESEQVLLMVMTGAAPKNEVAKNTTQRAVGLGYFLGSSLLGGVTGDAADADRLSITTGAKVSEGGNETYDIEYRLSPRWAVVAERSEFDEYNAGLKWRVLPRQTAEEKRKKDIEAKKGGGDARK